MITFDKKQSFVIKGIAILMMLYHHFFMYAVDQPFVFISPVKTTKLAWYSELCVALFSFCAGYGLQLAMKKCAGLDFKSTVLAQLKDIVRRGITLLVTVCIVLLLYHLYHLAVFHESFVWYDPVLDLIYIPRGSYNGHLWYARFYLIMLYYAPFLYGLFHRYEDKNSKLANIAFLVIYAALTVAITVYMLRIGRLDVQHNYFLYCYFEGYLFARFNVWTKISDFLQKILPDKHRNAYAAGLAVMVVTACSFFRIKVAISPAYPKYDFILLPFLIGGWLILFEEILWLKNILVMFGKYSMFMWIVHVFIWVDLLPVLFDRWGIKYHLALYAIVMLISLLVSYVLKQAEGLVFKWIKKAKQVRF